MVTGVAIAASTDPAVDDLTGPNDRDRSSFELRVPALQASVAADGSARITLEGFDERDRRAGAADLPARTFLVAIPLDATPVLDVTVLESDVVPGIRPRLVPARPKRSLFDAEAGQLVDVADEAIPEGPPPRGFAWLGGRGVLRAQAYVAVHVAPARFAPDAGGLRIARRLRLTVRFIGGSVPSDLPLRDEDRFEDLYRSRFVNYAQGLHFRNRPETRFAASAPAAPDAGPIYRIRVRANGVVRLDATRLSGTGFLTQPIATWKLMSGGVEIPMAVQDTNGNGLLDAGQVPPEWVQFYGQALDFEPKTILKNDLSTDKDIFEYRDVSDENVYVLSIESGTRARMTAQPGTPTGTATPPADFEAVALREVDGSWFPLGAADPWYWGPVQSNPASGSAVTTRTDTVALPGLASSTAPARVRVRLRGMTEDLTVAPDHHSRITLKNSGNTTLATNDDNGTFDGRTIYTHDVTWPGGSPGLTDPATVVTDALSVAASVGYKNQIVLDWIEVRYRRSFAASGDTLTFDYPDGDAEFEVTGFASSRVEVYEITGTIPGTSLVDAARVTGATVAPSSGTFAVRFTMTNNPALADGTPRRFVLAGDAGVSIPANPDFTSDTVSDLKSTANQADLIVIAHPAILGASSQATLNALLSLRASRGVTSKIAWIDDVQDEFHNGLSGPDAIRNFLAWVMSTAPGEGWAAPKPAYVMLIGDGSYDMKDQIAPKTNFLPTEILFQDDPQFGYYASDTLLAAVIGTDDIPDLVVGRLPARGDAEANTILTKILNYEQSAPAGNWRRHAILVSDRGKNYDPGEATDAFEATNDLAISKMKIPPHTRRRMRYWSDPQYCGGTQAGCTPLRTEQLRADIKAAINGTDGISDGAAIMQYSGHGNFNVWSDDAFFAQNWNAFFDVDQLANGGKLPWLIAQNCLTGGFESTIDITLGESFVRRSGGGAVAVFAPTGLSTTYVGADVTDTIWGDVFGPHKQRDIAVPVLDAVTGVCITGDVLPCQSYALLGDPALHLVIPEVQPATAVSATAGNARVDLAWTASTTGGATYDVYRSLSTPSGPYTKQNASPIAGTAYADTTAVNAKTYYYYVVALDASGFESRWSHFNTDCGAGNSDCLTATPLNPNPPAPPTGLVVTDPESGAKLNLSWNANSESDLKNYTVSWGTAPGVYTNTANAGLLTTYALTGLVDGTTYYIAITATNTSARTSAYSQEKPGTPTFVRGLRSPDFIATLTIDKSGTDAVLSWSAVTTDIYGKPATISSYEVYRGTTPTFVPGPGNKIAQPAAATWTDSGALSFANPNYYYLVRAVDASGNLGGLGNQLPNGIDTLSLSKTPDGLGGFTLGFSWPAVTSDFDGLPLTVDHYEVYGTDHPFTRADIKNGLVPLLASPSSATWSVTAPAASQYYSVLAVDARGNKSSF